MTDDERQDVRMRAHHADRTEMLMSLDVIFDRAKSLQRDKALGQMGVSTMGDPTVVEWDRVFPAPRATYEWSPVLIVHIGPNSGPARCGVTKGRVADPTTVTLLHDRWCVRCWGRWAKEAAAQAEERL